jgi:predicted metal-dependent phosphoesterase TrpH
MLIELHCHSDASGDSLMQPARMIATCRQRGIGWLAVTDHNTTRGALAVQALAPDLVMVGEEIMTTQGELLAYFVKEEVPPGLTPTETIARLRAQAAVISVAHPFDRLRHGAWREADLSAILPLVDALEVFNARCIFADDNARALAFARQHGKPGMVGSDAHTYWELGRAALRVDDGAEVGTPAALLRAFAAGQRVTRLSPAPIHFTSTWAKYWKRLRRRLQRKRG